MKKIILCTLLLINPTLSAMEAKEPSDVRTQERHSTDRSDSNDSSQRIEMLRVREREESCRILYRTIAAAMASGITCVVLIILLTERDTIFN